MSLAKEWTFSLLGDNPLEITNTYWALTIMHALWLLTCFNLNLHNSVSCGLYYQPHLEETEAQGSEVNLPSFIELISSGSRVFIQMLFHQNLNVNHNATLPYRRDVNIGQKKRSHVFSKNIFLML